MQEQPIPLLRVSTFGTFELTWLTAPSTTEALWESRTSARTLFKVLLCAPGRQASKSLLAGMLWPEVEEERARESLRSACGVLRKVLRTARGEELLVQRRTDDTLRLAGQTRLWVDADAFESLVSQASRATSSDAALALWEEANALLGGEFLATDQEAEWATHRLVKRRRQALWMARSRMVRYLAEGYVQRGELSRAEETLERHLLHFPTNQDALYRLLLLLEPQGRFEQASILYERSRRLLAEVGKQPATHVKTLYERFQRSILAQARRPLPETTAESKEPEPPAPALVIASAQQPVEAGQQAIHPMSEVLSLVGKGGMVDRTVEGLRVLLEPDGEASQDLSCRQLLELGIATLITRLGQLDSQRISAVEREALGRALGQSIADGWKLFHRAGNAEVLAVGQVQLSLIHQAHALVAPSSLPYLYTGTYGLIGIALHCQERDQEALQMYHTGYLAALATSDPWYIVASLISQADCYHALGQYSAAIQILEEALRVIGESTDEAYTRLKAHLLACWADNAMMLHDDRTTQEKLDISASYLDPNISDEEFDRAAWLLIAGKYALRTRNYVKAKDSFEQALVTLPEQWLLRRTMTETGLAMACARMGERSLSLTSAKNLIPLITATNAAMTNRWFAEYLQQDLLGTFPGDSEIQDFVDSYRQLPQGADILHSSK